jgi:hypothetical protein
MAHSRSDFLPWLLSHSLISLFISFYCTGQAIEEFGFESRQGQGSFLSSTASRLALRVQPTSYAKGIWRWKQITKLRQMPQL